MFTKFVALFLFLCGIAVAGQPIVLSINDVKARYSRGPLARQTELQFESVAAHRHINLQWRNPELEAEMEHLSSETESETEQVLGLHKSIMLPWARLPQRRFENSMLQAAEYERDVSHRFYLADLQSRYIELQSNQKLLKTIYRVRDAMDRAGGIAADRHEQGMLSGLENQLIQLSLFDVNATIIHLQRQTTQLRRDLKVDLAVPAADSLVLSTPLKFISIDLPELSRLMQRLNQAPQFMALQTRLQALEHQVDFAKGNVLPEIGVTAGYKQAGETMSGSVIGLSLPLPVLNQNRPQIHKAKLELSAEQIRAEQQKRYWQNRLQTLYTSVMQADGLFREQHKTFQSGETLIEDLLISFQEGYSSLNEVLNGVQVYLSSLQSYYSHLSHYYENIFKLEAMTGLELCQF